MTTLKRSAIRHDPSAPHVAQAAQVALVVMAITRKPDWAAVVADVDGALDKVELTDEQQTLLEEHRGILPYLSRGGVGGTLRTLFACRECGRFAFTSGAGAAPARCIMSLGCLGSPMKAKSQQQRVKETANA